MLRIASGEFKGLPLKVPASVRATESKVRQAIFNILGDFIAGARVLDGFAGSGSLGIEALSRGAAFVAFIELETDAVLCLRDNLERLTQAGLSRGAWRLLHLDIERGLRELARNGMPFDVILLDPPYRCDEGKNALNSVGECAMLARDGVLAIEHHRRTVYPPSIGPLRQRRQHRYGDTVLSLYQVTP